MASSLLFVFMGNNLVVFLLVGCDGHTPVIFMVFLLTWFFTVYLLVNSRVAVERGNSFCSLNRFVFSEWLLYSFVLFVYFFRFVSVSGYFFVSMLLYFCISEHFDDSWYCFVFCNVVVKYILAFIVILYLISLLLWFFYFEYFRQAYDNFWSKFE